MLFGNVPPFQHDVMKCWFPLTFDDIVDAVQVRNEIVWFISSVKTGGRLAFVFQMYQNGISRKEDLVDGNCI